MGVCTIMFVSLPSGVCFAGLSLGDSLLKCCLGFWSRNVKKYIPAYVHVQRLPESGGALNSTPFGVPFGVPFGISRC